jgi:protein O-GlcNAc transferase
VSDIQLKILRARGLLQRGQFAEAQALCEQVLRVSPVQVDTLMLLGQIAGQRRDLERAAACFGKVVDLAPGHAAAHCNRGLALQGLRKYEGALESYDRALAIQSDYAIAHFNRGNLLKDLGRSAEALLSYRRAVAVNPALSQAHYNRGVLLQETADFDAALVSYDCAIAANGNFADAHYNRGVALQRLERWLPALDAYDRVIALQPRPEAYCNRAVVLQRMERLEAALVSCNHAIALRPNYVEAFSNRGVVLHKLGKLADALASVDQALALKQDYAVAHCNRANVLRELKDYSASIDSYGRALALGCDSPGLLGLRRHAQLQICDWTGFAPGLAEIAGAIERHVAASPPFHLLVASDSPVLQRQGAEAWVRAEQSAGTEAIVFAPRPHHPKIRLGYFSADFRNHATAYLIAELFELHDKTRFEVVAFSFGPDVQDVMRQRVASACDQFLDVRVKSDREVAELALTLGIDIAIDLMGFTNHSRVGIFVARAAPVQVSYLGFPGTMGLPTMDYLIADRIVMPDGAAADYSEKVIYLPDCYQVNDRRRAVATQAFTREELGLPSVGFVFCCFNNSFKIAPATFDIWMSLLRRVGGSVLWLLEDNSVATCNLRREAQRRDVDPSRLVFGGRMSAPEHLARHAAADLFVDTLPYNAHTTASDALWAGLPVLTYVGNTFAGRVAASLLTAAGLPELITRTAAEFEARAVELAADSNQLVALRRRLAERRDSTALFDTPRFVRNLESAFRRIHERHLAGGSPQSIEI